MKNHISERPSQVHHLIMKVVRTQDSTIVDAGVLQHYLLTSYSAKMTMQS